ncbi:phenylalanine--tRNA ligase beta subunit-related protein, partial [Salmonella enterica]|uniref:phenylalanine--tRNA ligase beta subunit-related protein n=1 Tax=Salmonella enterica TaxID=28901 RepID=UPI00398C5585
PRDTDLRDELSSEYQNTTNGSAGILADGVGSIGVARGGAVPNKRAQREHEMAPVAATISDTLPNTVEAADACPRYLGRVVKGINVNAPTPLWMKEKMHRCRIRPIDAVVAGRNSGRRTRGLARHAFRK